MHGAGPHLARIGIDREVHIVSRRNADDVSLLHVGFGPDIVGRDRTDGAEFVTPKYAFPSVVML